jgi:hypothetical protein
MIPLEQRRHPREHSGKHGRIVLSNGSGVRCVIRNLSPFGACLQVASHFGIPQEIFLVKDGEHFKRPCRVAWRSNHQLGVFFTSGVVKK